MKNNTLSKDHRVYVNLLSDVGFKIVFGNPQNKSILIGLLNLVLPPEAHVQDIETYLDRERTPTFLEGKKTLLDLICRDDRGQTFEVEIQRDVESSFFKRCVFYASDLYHSQMEAGNNFDILKPVYLISFLERKWPHRDESEWDTNRLISRYRFMEERTKDLTEPTIIITFAELGRFSKTLEECVSEQDYLFYWFLNGWRYETVPEQYRHTSFKEELTRATELAGFSKDELIVYNNALMNDMDYRNALHQAKAQGLAEGKAQGLDEGKTKGIIEAARKMINAGVDIKLVAKTLGVDVSQLK
ncbi:MAG TPA: hypothetical protein DDX33_01560 [Rikenellaceae bacterium]|nr:hypothetical protein [Rikenellaceae bacterium]